MAQAHAADLTAAAAPARRFRVAGFWARAGAGTADLLVLLPVLLLVRLVVGLLAPHDVPPLSSAGLDIAVELYLGGSAAFLSLTLLAVALFLGYFAVFWGLTGRTLGQRLFAIRVVDVYGERPSLARALVRSFGFVLGAELLVWLLTALVSPDHKAVVPFAGAVLVALGVVWCGFDREKRGLHDWLAGTYVVRG